MASALTSMLALLSACGGPIDSAPAKQMQAAPLASGITMLQLDPATLPALDAQQFALPAFHMAPVLLDAPADAVAGGDWSRAAHLQSVPGEFRQLSSRRLTVQAMRARHDEAGREAMRQGMRSLTPDASAAPLASGSYIATYNPAQIRAAYGLPALPVAGGLLTAAQAAQLGAGQTIYIVDAKHDPNIAAELAAFNQKFGLPACANKTIASNATLPLPAASSSACELLVVYSTAAGAMTATQPAYDAGWATEITLDVQWAHATAPLARIVLIEAADANYNSLLGGVKLANAMGPGVVSMSFGGSEISSSSADSAFAGSNMTYLAATGDSGAGVSWPASSARVLAVGGTTLTYSGAGLRSETVWSGTGGGVSQYVALPSYQSNSVPGMGSAVRRTVADVAFNADPNSGQYVAVIPSGASSVNWTSAGGTSLATPQWAGLVAVANAMRAQGGKAALGAPHALLYGQISTVPGSYASAFADIIKGSNGTCATCSARTGYDPATGLGTPNAASLLATLSGTSSISTPVVSAPVVTSASIAGKVGTALSFTVSAASGNALSYTLSGAPSGMTINSAGVVAWAVPVAGTYAVTVTATDSKTALTGKGVYTVVIAAASTTTTVKTATGGPVITAAAITGVAGRPLTGLIAISSSGSGSVSIVISGAPLGMMFSISGMNIVPYWSSPVSGSYQMTVVATDAGGNSARVVVPVTVTAQ